MLLWSDAATWAGSRNVTGVDAKPVAGQNVTIPLGWTVMVDEDTAAMNLLVVRG